MKILDVIELLGDVLRDRIRKNESETKAIAARLDSLERKVIDLHRAEAKRAKAPLTVGVRK